jgi:hypothetical protein
MLFGGNGLPATGATVNPLNDLRTLDVPNAPLCTTVAATSITAARAI